MSYPESYSKQFKRLLKVVSDSQQGYREAADKIDSDEYKDLFLKIADQRQTLVDELREMIARFGGDANKEETDVLATLHRGWMGIKSAMSRNNTQAILESCRNGDQAALDVYDDILQGDLLNDTEIKTFLTGQRLAIDEVFLDLDRRYFELFKRDPAL